MDKEEFIKMTMQDQLNYLWNYGEILFEKVYYDCNISLFLLDNFYVEVFFNRVQNEVVSVEVQDNKQILYEYVKNISLDELIKS
jgi:hypothetical protein